MTKHQGKYNALKEMIAHKEKQLTNLEASTLKETTSLQSQMNQAQIEKDDMQESLQFQMDGLRQAAQ